MIRFKGFIPRAGTALRLLSYAAVAGLLSLSPSAAHLSTRAERAGDLLEQAPLRSVIAERGASAAARYRAGGWRCEAICDAEGHLRQSCLMLEDPRLSGLGQALDHLSKAEGLTKSLVDLGLDTRTVGPTC